MHNLPRVTGRTQDLLDRGTEWSQSGLAGLSQRKDRVRCCADENVLPICDQGTLEEEGKPLEF